MRNTLARRRLLSAVQLLMAIAAIIVAVCTFGSISAKARAVVPLPPSADALAAPELNSVELQPLLWHGLGDIQEGSVSVDFTTGEVSCSAKVGLVIATPKDSKLVRGLLAEDQPQSLLAFLGSIEISGLYTSARPEGASFSSYQVDAEGSILHLAATYTRVVDQCGGGLDFEISCTGLPHCLPLRSITLAGDASSTIATGGDPIALSQSPHLVTFSQLTIDQSVKGHVSTNDDPLKPVPIDHVATFFGLLHGGTSFGVNVGTLLAIALGALLIGQHWRQHLLLGAGILAGGLVVGLGISLTGAFGAPRSPMIDLITAVSWTLLLAAFPIVFSIRVIGVGEHIEGRGSICAAYVFVLMPMVQSDFLDLRTVGGPSLLAALSYATLVALLAWVLLSREIALRPWLLMLSALLAFSTAVQIVVFMANSTPLESPGSAFSIIVIGTIALCMYYFLGREIVAWVFTLLILVGPRLLAGGFDVGFSPIIIQNFLYVDSVSGAIAIMTGWICVAIISSLLYGSARQQAATPIIVFLPLVATAPGSPSHPLSVGQIASIIVLVALMAWVIDVNPRSDAVDRISVESQRLALLAELKRRAISQAAALHLRSAIQKVSVGEMDIGVFGARQTVLDDEAQRLVVLPHVSGFAMYGRDIALGAGAGLSRHGRARRGVLVAVLLALPAEIAYLSAGYVAGSESFGPNIVYALPLLRWALYGAMFGYFYTAIRGSTPIAKSMSLLIAILPGEILWICTQFDNLEDTLVLISITAGQVIVLALGLGLYWERLVARQLDLHWGRIRDFHAFRGVLTPVVTIIVAALTTLATGYAAAAVTATVPKPPMSSSISGDQSR